VSLKLTSTHPNGGVYAALLDDVRDVYDSAVEAQQWMLSGQEQLGGQSPLQLIKEGRADEVRRLIEQLKSRVTV
jgi:uncharacterized protein (DUF2384 family)